MEFLRNYRAIHGIPQVIRTDPQPFSVASGSKNFAKSG